MEFKNIAILGAGAVGSYMYWGLQSKQGINLYLIADGKRKETLESEGLTINGKLYKPLVKKPSEASDTDLLIVTTKYTALNAALDDIAVVAGERTTVISLLNGVDSEDIIGAKVGKEKILHSLIKVAAERKDHSVKFDPESTVGVIYGEKDLSRGKERTDALARLFEGSGVHFRCTDVIMSEIWSKFRLNVSNNQPQAVLSVGVGAYTDSEHVAFIQKKLGEEVDALAKAKGIDMSLADKTSAKGSKVQPRARYSTLQDLDAKRHTEVDVFAGACVKMGKELGVPTPYNEAVFHLIKALEEKNDGKFDYE